MKLLEIAIPDDGKQFYRDVAKAAIKGNDEDPKKSAPVQLYETTRQETEVESGKTTTAVVDPPSKHDIGKLVNQLRSGLASVKEGRFSVTHKSGNIAWVTVNDNPVRERLPKKAAGPAKSAGNKPAAK